RSAAVNARRAAGPGHPDRSDRLRPTARTGGTSAARGSRGSGRRDRPVTSNLAWPPTGLEAVRPQWDLAVVRDTKSQDAPVAKALQTCRFAPPMLTPPYPQFSPDNKKSSLA